MQAFGVAVHLKVEVPDIVNDAVDIKANINYFGYEPLGYFDFAFESGGLRFLLKFKVEGNTSFPEKLSHYDLVSKSGFAVRLVRRCTLTPTMFSPVLCLILSSTITNAMLHVFGI